MRHELWLLVLIFGLFFFSEALTYSGKKMTPRNWAMQMFWLVACAACLMLWKKYG